MKNKLVWIVPLLLAVMVVVFLLLLHRGDSQAHVYQPF